METRINDYELIQRFFDFELNDKELQQFEARMENDAEFRERFQIYKTMEQHITNTYAPSEKIARDAIKEKWKNYLKKAEDEKNVTPSRRLIPLRFLLRAAAVLLLILTAWFLIQPIINKKAPPKELATQYWEKENKVIFSNVRSSSIDQNDSIKLILENASKAFSEGKYEQVISSIQNDSLSTLDARLLLLLGESFMELKYFSQAISQFQSVIDAPNNSFKDVALWYQSLAYLQLNQVEQAEINLEYIINQKYPMAHKAQDLLRKIE